MTPATLTTEHTPDGVRVLLVDCEHGETRIACVPGDSPSATVINELAMVKMAVSAHYSVEKCRCTLPLRRRYRVTI